MTVPPFVAETLTGSSAVGTAPSANSRLPVPMTTEVDGQPVLVDEIAPHEGVWARSPLPRR